MKRNIFIKVQYDGSRFSGWQRQPDKRTVQGVLEEGLSKFCGKKITLNGASRTDAGVHALGQTACFEGDFAIPAHRLKIAMNNYLAGGLNQLNPISDIRILTCEEADIGFHARFNALGKTYRYIIHNGDEPDIFRREYAYYVATPLDIKAMEEGAKGLVGTHDFKAFQSSGGQERLTTVRHIYKIDIYKKNEDVIIEITGDGFLYNMVRNIVGTLVEIGLGKRRPEEVSYILESLERKNAGHKAPAQGLYLVEVYYDKTKLG